MKSYLPVTGSDNFEGKSALEAGQAAEATPDLPEVDE
jgi:hypothetical protein